MKFLRYIASFGGLVIACFFEDCRPSLADLDFFSVKTLRAEPGPALGQVLLRDSIGGVGPEGVDEHGFYWSDDAALLEKPAPTTARILFGPTQQNGIADTAVHLPDASKTYYFRAFAQRGERWVLAPQTQPFSLDLAVQIEEQLTETDNDRIRITARVSGLNRLRAVVSEFGFVWSETNPVPDLSSDVVLLQKSMLNHDGLFKDSLNGLIPGKSYYVRAFLKNAQRVFFSPVGALEVKETWISIPKPFDGQGVWGSWATVTTDRAFVGCGVDGGIPTDGIAALSGDLRSDIWEFSAVDGQWTKWNISEPFDFDFNRFNAVAFTIGNHLFVGTGSKTNTILGDLYQFDHISRTFLRKLGNAPLGFDRMNAVSFVLDGKAYIGTGNTKSNGNLLLNDFFVYEPVFNTWDTIPPLPIFSDTTQAEVAGRRSAVAFVIGQRAYVTGGYRANPAAPASISFDLLSDCVAYDPTLRQWLPMQPFPGEARSDAVAFVIGGKAFIGLGYGKNNGFLSDWWCFDPTAVKQWEQVSVNFPIGRADAVAFALQNKGYSFGGRTVQPTLAGVYRGFILNDCWMYRRK